MYFLFLSAKHIDYRQKFDYTIQFLYCNVFGYIDKYVTYLSSRQSVVSVVRNNYIVTISTC